MQRCHMGLQVCVFEGYCVSVCVCWGTGVGYQDEMVASILSEAVGR